MWKYANWNKVVKIIISVLLGLTVIVVLTNPPKEPVKDTQETNTEQRQQTQQAQPQQPAASAYSYDWGNEGTNTYWLLAKDVDNSSADLKDRIKATIADFSKKVSFTTNTLVSVTDNANVFKCETLAGKPGYTGSEYVACLNEAGGKDAYNAATSAHNIALYSHNFKYNMDATECKDKCNELMFYPDASKTSEQAKYKETLYWKP